MTTPQFDTSRLAKDFSPTGMKVEGPYENDRNACYRGLYQDIVREVYGDIMDDTAVLVGHHIAFMVRDVVPPSPEFPNGYTLTTMQEIPSADTLIFDHDVARKLWGNWWKHVLSSLAMTPAERRDAALAAMYYTERHMWGKDTYPVD